MRIQRLLGDEAMARLRSARVTVVGLGAVGSYCVEGLARAGVGALRLLDFDEIRPSNINRQLYALGSTLGRMKAEVAQARVADINPDCEVVAEALFVRADTVDRALTPAPDLLIDAIDSLNPKVTLLAEAHRRGIPTLSSMGAARRTDPTRICMGDIGETEICPLARLVRKRLRRLGIQGGIACVYSTEPVGEEASDVEATGESAPFVDEGRRRQTLGSLPTLTGIFGLTLANAAINQLSCAFPKC